MHNTPSGINKTINNFTSVQVMLCHYNELNVCVSPNRNSHVEILTPNVMVLGGGAFWRQLGHDGGALMNGISALIGETPGGSLAFFSSCENTRSWQFATRKSSTILAP